MGKRSTGIGFAGDPAEQQLVSNFFDGAILQSDDCGGGPCFSIGFSGP